MQLTFKVAIALYIFFNYPFFFHFLQLCLLQSKIILKLSCTILSSAEGVFGYALFIGLHSIELCIHLLLFIWSTQYYKYTLRIYHEDGERRDLQLLFVDKVKKL